MNFKNYLNESKDKFSLVNDDGEFIIVSGKSISFTKDVKKAKTWNEFLDVIDWEDANSNNFDDFTTVVKIKNNKAVEINQATGKEV